MLCRTIFVCAVVSHAFAQTQSDAVREQYNGTYANAGEQNTFNHEPNAFLVEMLRTWKPGRALDVGMGQGRNAIWLAKQGWNVTGFDLSDAGVKLAQEKASEAGVKIKAVVANADEFDFGLDHWDLIVLSYVPFSSYRDRLIRSLKPGGVVLVEFLHEDTRRVRLFSGGFQEQRTHPRISRTSCAPLRGCLGEAGLGCSVGRQQPSGPTSGTEARARATNMRMGAENVCSRR